MTREERARRIVAKWERQVWESGPVSPQQKLSDIATALAEERKAAIEEAAKVAKAAIGATRHEIAAEIRALGEK